MVVGRPAARPGLGVRLVLRHRLGPGPRWPNRVAGVGFRRRRRRAGRRPRRPTSRRSGLPHRPGHRRRRRREVHDRQHYRLVGWRNGACGYRRFFSITSLAGLRQEDPAVFERTHAEVARWFADGTGRRCAHRPSGRPHRPGRLPQMLRRLLGPQAWIVIEKIPRSGTLGPQPADRRYDRLRRAARGRRVFIDPAGAEALTAMVDSAGFEYAAVPDMLRELKIRTTTETLASELGVPDHQGGIRRRPSPVGRRGGGAVDQHRRLPLRLPGALADPGRGHRTHRGGRPGLAAPLAVVATALANPGGESAARLQQLCGAMTAKSVEDCYFYRDPGWCRSTKSAVSRNSSASAPRSSTAAPRCAPAVAADHDDAVHPRHQAREDVRARIGVLSQVPSLWAQLVDRWEAHTLPDPLTGLFLWQNIFGVWPADGVVSTELRRRLHDYTEKAIREAPRQDVVERPRHRVSSGPCTAGSTRFWTDPSPPNSPNWSPSWSRTRTTTRSARSCCRSPFPVSRRLPGHRVVGGQPRRPGQPQARRLRRAAHRAGSAGAPGRFGGRGRPCTPAATGPTPSCTAAISRCWRPVRPRSTSWRSHAVTTSWWR